ncbi:MAG: non-ribosomal peptide synthetase [Terracidiphilus sp.]
MLPVQWLEWNRTEVDYSRSSTIADLFRQQAALTPDTIALIHNDRQLSYKEVDERSDNLATQLQAHGVKPESLVGVSIGRSETLVIAILAILKAGGAYVPLEPSNPKERLSYVIEDSGMQVLLCSAETRGRVPLSQSLSVVDVENPGGGAAQDSRSVSSTASSHDLAYVIYTSGSTGKPKGVMVEHRNVVNFFAGMDRAIGSAPGVWLAVTSVAFDISVLETLWTLTRGFTVVVHGDEGTGSIADEIIRHHATHLQMTPSLAHIVMLDKRAYLALGLLKQILLGGEAVPASVIHRLRQVFNGEIHNMYGPTETTIWSTTYLVREPGITVPIGRPIANTKVFLLDHDLNPVPVGEPGELFIGGDGVARGYWNRPELTAERFLNLPSLSGQPVYRTGDLARFLPDGNIEFLGRADDQIKLRGHRIEPREIEAHLEECAGIRQAVVVAREDREGDKRLVAYVVAEGIGKEAVGMLKSALGARLPEVMIPSAFLFLSALPLTENGKIDRRALLGFPPPVLEEAALARRSQSAPQSEIERIICEAWKEALGLPEVGLNENFFDLGAHSLTIAEVQAKLQNSLQREVPLVDLFEFPTVASLAHHLAGSESLPATARIADRAQRRRSARQH